MFTFTLIRCIGKEIGSHKSIFFRCLFHCQRNIHFFYSLFCLCLCFLCNSVIYSSSFSMSCSSQATKTKHCLDRSDMLLLFSHPVSLYMCNNSRNGANLSGSFIFTLLRFYILRIILPFHQNIFRNFTNKKMDISKIIHDRITPCIANQIRIRIFINNGYQVVFCISAVTRDDDMIFAVKFRYNLPDHGGCQFQFRLFFLPHTITKRNGKMRYFISIPDRYEEHDSHKAVSIQIVGTVVCGPV